MNPDIMKATGTAIALILGKKNVLTRIDCFTNKEQHMSLSRDEIEKALRKWNLAWDNHDLEGVMDLFHEEIVFDNWKG